MELKLRVVDKFADARLGALVAAVNSERVAGVPSGRLFMDSIEQALAIALVDNYAVRRPSARIYRGGLTPARLRRVVELVHAEMEGDLSLEDLADAGPEPAPVCVAPPGRPCQRDVACRRDAGAGCGGGLRVQEPAALCAGLPQCVRCQSYTIPAGICAPETSRGSVNKALRQLRQCSQHHFQQRRPVSSRCLCTSAFCNHHPVGGPCTNERLELRHTLKESSDETTEPEDDYGLCAACWMARDGTY